MLTTASFLRESGLHQWDEWPVETTYDLLLQISLLLVKANRKTLYFFCCYPDTQLYIGLM